ncbi:MAG: ABC transporter permease [Oscillospiraceae bacterium]|nr:ABC transporter permease [Oscillospiraceae bacterium]
MTDANKGKKSFLSFLKRFLFMDEFMILVVLIALCAAMSILTDRFLTMTNIMNVLRQISTVGITATGLAFVIMTGGMDLSTGSIISIGGMTLAFLYTHGVNIYLALLLALLLGAVIGSINGMIIMRFSLNPFVVTLATSYIIKGFSYLYTQGMPVSFTGTPINYLGSGYLFGKIPMMAVCMIVVLIIGHIVLTKTPYGKYVLAVGGNMKAAELSGLPVVAIRVIAYAMVGVLASFSGVLYTCNLNMADSATGIGYETNILAAVVIGGTPLGGGKGTIFGVFIGAAIMGIIKNAFVLLNISTYWQYISIGAIILIAIMSERLKKVRY